MHTIPLETDRLILRKFEDKDMQPLHLLLMDETVTRSYPGSPSKVWRIPGHFTKRILQARHIISQFVYKVITFRSAM